MLSNLQELSEGVNLITVIISDYERDFEVENNTESTVNITMNLAGSEGVSMVDHLDLICSAEVPPSQKVLLVKIFHENSWSLNFCLNFQEPASYYISPDDSSPPVVEDEFKADVEIFKAFYRSNNLYAEISPETLPESRKNFIDPYFPPIKESIYRGEEGVTINEKIIWRRPSAFLPDDVAVFSKIEPADIKQGSLANCWFMCSISCVAERPELVEKLFITKEVQPHGAYKVKFCKGGEWVEVTVDDYFPVVSGMGPIFSRSHGSEIWVLLLEKAYAKLHGSYMLLRYGKPFQALQDLTGCPTGCFLFENSRVKDMISSGEFWNFMKIVDDEGGLLAACTQGNDKFTEGEGPDSKCGLVPGHSYTVIKLREVNGHKLLNIRNPWGEFEWDGDWSDTSALWTPEIIDEIQPNFDANDGTFWMSFEDFLRKFFRINYCRMGNFHEVRMKGLFEPTIYKEEEVIFSREIYSIQCDEYTKLFLTLHQDDERIYGVSSLRSYLDIGIVFLEADGDDYQIINYTYQIRDRNVNLEVDLVAGKKYLIVPLTTGCHLSRDSKDDNDIQLLKDNEFDPLLESVLKDIFRKANTQLGPVLSLPEFQALVSPISLCMSKHQFEGIKSRHASTEEGITQEGFLEYIRSILQNEKGEGNLRSWLTEWGYDQYLYSVKSRAYVVSMHSYSPLIVEPIDSEMKNQLTAKTWGLLLRNYGYKFMERQGVKYYTLTNNSTGTNSFGAYNCLDQDITATADMSASEGVIFTLGKNLKTKRISPGDYGAFIHYTQSKLAKDTSVGTKFLVDLN
jgi:calpain-15